MRLTLHTPPAVPDPLAAIAANLALEARGSSRWAAMDTGGAWFGYAGRPRLDESRGVWYGGRPMLFLGAAERVGHSSVLWRFDEEKGWVVA